MVSVRGNAIGFFLKLVLNHDNEKKNFYDMCCFILFRSIHDPSCLVESPIQSQ